MTQYLGISMVIVVTALCIAILAKLVTGNILDEFERIRSRRAKRRAEAFVAALKGGLEYGTKYMNYVKEAVELDKKYGAEGNKYASIAFKQTSNEMLNEFEKANK